MAGQASRGMIAVGVDCYYWAMLTLPADYLMSRGANRACYRHPDDAGRCIKLDLEPGVGRRPGMNQIEFENHSKLVKRLGERFYRHAPRCYGFVQTNEGKGLCFELVRDAGGGVSTRFDRYLGDTQCEADHAHTLIDRLYAFVLDADARLFDVNLHNLMVRQDADGSEQLVAIDWKGPKALREFIPASNYLPWFARRKIARRFVRLHDQAHSLAAG